LNRLHKPPGCPHQPDLSGFVHEPDRSRSAEPGTCALPGYVLGYLPSTLMSMGEAAGQAPQAEPAQWLTLVLAAGLGAAAVPVGARHVSPLQGPASPLLQPASSLWAPWRESGRAHGVHPGSLGAMIGSFKSSVSRRAGRDLNSGNIWQRNYYEHILRNEANYEKIAGYIMDNPANWEQDDENPLGHPLGRKNDTKPFLQGHSSH
jgi:hypothetical protein